MVQAGKANALPHGLQFFQRCRLKKIVHFSQQFIFFSNVFRETLISLNGNSTARLLVSENCLLINKMLYGDQKIS